MIEPFGGAGHRGVFERGTVRIEDSSGAVVARRDDPRPMFAKPSRIFHWDDLDQLYFGGYALWGYLNAPFVFADPRYEAREVEPWVEHGETWRGLEVSFPDDVPAHSKLQRFYFDERGCCGATTTRPRSSAVGRKAAHYCWDHQRDGRPGRAEPPRRA